jgi:hypothetical protein
LHHGKVKKFGFTPYRAKEPIILINARAEGDKNQKNPELNPREEEPISEVHSFEKHQPIAVTPGTSYDEWCLSQIAKSWNKPGFSHDVLANGGKLVFEMGKKANYNWGSSLNDAPPSSEKMN